MPMPFPAAVPASPPNGPGVRHCAGDRTLSGWAHPNLVLLYGGMRRAVGRDEPTRVPSDGPGPMAASRGDALADASCS